MARRAPWLVRISDIRRSVRDSVRSHYDRHDIERLFQIQSRPAQKLMSLVGVGARVGQCALVNRETLADFLGRLAESNAPQEVLQAERIAAKTPDGRRALRELIQADGNVATLDTMPRNIIASTGKLVIEFNRIQELAGALLALAQVMENELEEFVDRFEPVFEDVKPEHDSVVDDLRRAFADLRQDEQEKADRLQSQAAKMSG